MAIGVQAGDAPDCDGWTLDRLTLEPTEALRARYLGAADGAVYLIRPDQHVAARWDHFDAGEVAAALARATGRG
jgi:3-(3-hydroxy-phenyl)propionate hydroxylase